MVTIDLGDYLAEARYENVKIKVVKCPDPNAFFTFNISNTLINVTSGSETMSMMSGAKALSSMDSDPESAYNFKELEEPSKEKTREEKMKARQGRQNSFRVHGGMSGLPRAPVSI